MPSTELHLTLKRQSGLSLIELMVSMMIGLFLLGGLATNLISTTKLDKSRQAVGEMDANAQLTMDFIRQAVANAGYPSMRNIRLDKAFYTEADGDLPNPECRIGSIKRDIAGFTPTAARWTRDGYLSDVLTVVSLADNPCVKGEASCENSANVNPQAMSYFDCAGGGRERDQRTVSCSTDIDVGMHNPTEAKIFSTFRLDTHEKTLICEGSRGGRETLADGIHAMQFLYGVQTESGDTSYKNADDVESSNEWGLVNSVQVALLMTSANEKGSEATMSQAQYKLLDTIVSISSEQRHRVYRVYTMTVNLANME